MSTFLQNLAGTDVEKRASASSDQGSAKVVMVSNVVQSAPQHLNLSVGAWEGKITRLQVSGTNAL